MIAPERVRKSILIQDNDSGDELSPLKFMKNQIVEEQVIH
jgi:hypothetical protein